MDIGYSFPISLALCTFHARMMSRELVRYMLYPLDNPCNFWNRFYLRICQWNIGRTQLCGRDPKQIFQLDRMYSLLFLFQLHICHRRIVYILSVNRFQIPVDNFLLMDVV